MSVFWTLYWLGFLGIPLVLLLATIFVPNGAAASGSHIWVYKGTRRKVKDASVKEVWQRHNPGKSWEKHQSAQYIGCAVFLVIVFLVFLAWLAAEIFMLPTERTGLRLFWQIGAPILGALSAGLVVGGQSLITDALKSGFFKALQLLFLVLVGIGLIGALVLTFLKHPLPISQHWIWAPIGGTLLVLILDSIFSGTRQKKAGKGGAKIEDWVMEVIQMIHQWDPDDYGVSIAFAAYEVEQGKHDWAVRNEDFFKLTESIFLDLIGGKPMSIGDQDIYRARDQVVKAVQTIYFYCVKTFPEFDLHPRIKRALSKH
jgi:hypothetical protein